MKLSLTITTYLLFSISLYAQSNTEYEWNDDWKKDSTEMILFSEEENKYECDTINFTSQEIEKRLKTKVKQALVYNKKHNLSQDICILIDMGVHSGNYRFFVYDFKKEKVIQKALVSHGCGIESWSDDNTRSKPVFSNTPESHLSSIGKYRIGKRGVSSWGIKVNYKMHGLEKTNNNAYKRIIVLHSWSSVLDQETYPMGTPEGWGCPAVSNNTMIELDKLLKGKKDVLMWLYN